MFKYLTSHFSYIYTEFAYRKNMKYNVLINVNFRQIEITYKSI